MSVKTMVPFALALLTSFSDPSLVSLASNRPEVHMVLIPADEFAMGSDRGQNDEQPVHRVFLRAFYLDAH